MGGEGAVKYHKKRTKKMERGKMGQGKRGREGYSPGQVYLINGGCCM